MSPQKQRTKLKVRSSKILVFLILACLAAFAQSDQKDSRYYESLARKAYQEKNYTSFLANMRLAADLRVNHPRLMYELATAYALNGKSNEALSLLKRATGMGLVFPLATDHDFDSVRSLPEFTAILKEIEENRSPKISSVPAFTVHEKGLVPESIAYDERTDTFYLSSVYKRKILSITNAGDAKVFSSDTDGLWSVMGMKVDPERRLLWVCTTAHSQMMNFNPQDKGKTALIKYDLRSGKVLARFESGDSTKPHWFGDLVINSAGDVYTSDSVTAAVYVVRHDGNELETLLEGEPFVSPQGLDFTPDEKKLFLADYAKGVFLIDLITKKVTSISADFTLLGIDGLYYYRGSLIGVQNGVNPERVIKLSLSQDLTRFDHFATLEANNPAFDEPTLGVLLKDRFYVIANSQWGAIDEAGHLAPDDKLKYPIILKIKL
ncbi:MAG TPA: SMP-30/gluconolactonase/LRE family protein [Pyrinomonadaceae bacterium]